MLEKIVFLFLILGVIIHVGRSASVKFYTEDDFKRDGSSDSGEDDGIVRFKDPNKLNNFTFRIEVGANITKKSGSKLALYKRKQFLNNTEIWGFAGTWRLREDHNDALFLQGSIVGDISSDLSSRQPTLSAKDTFNIAFDHLNTTSGIVDVYPKRDTDIKKDFIIFIDPTDSKAKYAYFHELSVVRNRPDDINSHEQVSAFIMVDAFDGSILSSVVTQISARSRESITNTWGYGGNQNIGVYRYGEKEYYNRWLKVTLNKKGDCLAQNKHVMIRSALRPKLKSSGFNPSTQCFNPNLYLPFKEKCNSSSAQPTNYVVNQVNDALFLVDKCLEMLKNVFQDRTFENSQLRVCVHSPPDYERIPKYDPISTNKCEPRNNFDCYYIYLPEPDASDSEHLLSYVSPTLIGHEIGHPYYHRATGAAQAGDINIQAAAIIESFCDLFGIMLKAYLHDFQTDWKIGNEVLKDTGLGTAMRYMNDPPLDGVSVDHVKNYNPTRGIHYNNGIFNKAIYNLASMPNWDLIKVFKVFTIAARCYWKIYHGFLLSLKGLIDSADNLGFSKTDVRMAFRAVGLIDECPEDWKSRNRQLGDINPKKINKNDTDKTNNRTEGDLNQTNDTNNETTEENLFKLNDIISCFKAYAGRLQWKNAQEICKSMNAELLTIETTEKFNWLITDTENLWDSNIYHFGNSIKVNIAWTAASDMKEEGRWHWHPKGNPVDFNQFPNNTVPDHNTRKNCLAMVQINGTWLFEHRDCQEQLGFVCQIE